MTFLREVARGAAIELFHLLTFNGCGRWVWAWHACAWLEGDDESYAARYGERKPSEP